jgi:VWFA-related protein
VIVVFTDGMDSPGNDRQNNSSLGDVMKRAEAENVMVYAIGLIGSAPSFGGGFGGRGGPRGFGGGGPRNRGRLEDKPDPGLPKIAAATGGGYFELTAARDLAQTFTKVVDELHHQYALGFTPPELDGKTHSLQVKVLQPGLTARARKSYLAAKE